MSILLELDPNIVKPGWTPLLITLGLALAMVLLFRSMRRQFRRVDENFPQPPDDDATDSNAAPTDGSATDRVAGTTSEAEPRHRT
jgi:hypothetical protein